MEFSTFVKIQLGGRFWCQITSIPVKKLFWGHLGGSGGHYDVIRFLSSYVEFSTFLKMQLGIHFWCQTTSILSRHGEKVTFGSFGGFRGVIMTSQGC